MSERWKHLKSGHIALFGLIQIDIQKHSQWDGAEIKKQLAKKNLKNYVIKIANLYEFKEFYWPGDGGILYFPIIDLANDYNILVQCALHIKNEINIFNSLSWQNMLGYPVAVRISCHADNLIYSQYSSEVHGQGLNVFLKYERIIGFPETVTLTDAVYSQLTNEDLKELFNKVESDDGKEMNKILKMSIYRYFPQISEYRYEVIQWNIKEISQQINTSKQLRIFASGSNTYYDLFSGIINSIGINIFSNLSGIKILIRRRENNSIEYNKIIDYLERWDALSKKISCTFEYAMYDFYPLMLRGIIFDNRVAYIGFYLRKEANQKSRTLWGSNTSLLCFYSDTPVFRYCYDIFESLWEDNYRNDRYNSRL